MQAAMRKLEETQQCEREVEEQEAANIAAINQQLAEGQQRLFDRYGVERVRAYCGRAGARLRYV